jgi:tetratricopeptide (TPR) repeat protein
MPATAEEGRWVEAVIGLEKAGRHAAAAEGYLTALGRWPRNLAAMVGLGNSRYAMGDVEGSEAAFRRATEAFPEEGTAFNNLAHVLAELGRREEALAAARRAVALGGPHQDTFRKTFEEIQSAPP